MSLPSYPFERERYWVDRQPASPHDYAGGASRSVAKRKVIADWFYVPVWKQTPLPWLARRAEACEEPVRWLIFAAEESVSEGIRQGLEEAGEELIIVKSGDGFAEIGAGHYQIHPGRLADYVELLESLQAGGKFPQRIAHLWSMQAATEKLESGKAPESATELGFYSLIYLAQALGKTSSRDCRRRPERRVAHRRGDRPSAGGERGGRTATRSRHGAGGV